MIFKVILVENLLLMFSTIRKFPLLFSKVDIDSLKPTEPNQIDTYKTIMHSVDINK